MSEQREIEAARLENARMIHCQWLEHENAVLRAVADSTDIETHKADIARLTAEKLRASLEASEEQAKSYFAECLVEKGKVERLRTALEAIATHPYEIHSESAAIARAALAALEETK